MAELSNAVTVLIARMESHPEDFDVSDGGLYSKSKFGEMVNGLYALTEIGSTTKNAFWYLNDADKQALVDAWKKYHYTKFEKLVMEKIFDDGSAERDAEELKQRIAYQQMRVHQAQMQNQLMNAAQHSPGQFVPVSNAAQNNAGLLGSAANAFSGIFK